jgi:Gti1/Pac2 family transcription factor
MSHYDRSSQHPMGLVKQTISAQVMLAPNTRPRKWHLTAYFTYSDLPNIPTIEQDPILRKIVVPQGIYLSGKSRSRNSDGGSANRSTSSPPPSSPQMGSTYYPLYPPPSSPRPDASVPPILPSIHAAVPDMRYGHSPQSRSNLRRPSEDQRMIHMLNSRHIM